MTATAPGAFDSAPIASPAVRIRPVTASDTVNVPLEVCRALLVGTAGNARIIDASGVDTGNTNLVPLQAGYNPIGVQRIFATGLTAANIWALY